MEIRTQSIITHRLDGTTDTATKEHLYATHGHFQEGGWHIELGTGADSSTFHEVDDGTIHDVPATLPDIEIQEEEQDNSDEPATIEDYEAVINALAGGNKE